MTDTPRAVAPEGTVRVLIVDDEPELTELLSVAVTGAGRQPFLAADGHSALRIARGCAPHAVVLDGMLRQGVPPADLPDDQKAPWAQPC